MQLISYEYLKFQCNFFQTYVSTCVTKQFYNLIKYDYARNITLT